MSDEQKQSDEASEPTQSKADDVSTTNNTPYTEPERVAADAAVVFDTTTSNPVIRDAEVITNAPTETLAADPLPEVVSAPQAVSHTKAIRFGVITTVVILILVVLGIKYLGKLPLIQKYADNAYNVVALVNGERVLQKEFDQQLAFLMQTAVAQQRDVNDPTLQGIIYDQALDLLVNAKILTQAAEQAGMTVDPSAIDSQYALIAEQYGTEEEFLAQVTALGFTTEKVRENIHDEILIGNYIQSAIPESAIAVTEAEIKNYYAQESATRTDVPPLDVVKGQIETFLKQQKEQVEMQRIIEELRTAATIEIVGEEGQKEEVAG